MIEKKITEKDYFATSMEWKDTIIIVRKEVVDGVLTLYYMEKRCRIVQ